MKLYQNEISSATSRVRIALALKGLTVETQSIGILGTDAESRQSDYRRINPQGLVPALLTDDEVLLTQSLAIVEYLDEIHPLPPLLPTGPESRALARSIALAIAAEIHALVPPRVALHLAATFGADAAALGAWSKHWVKEGLDAVEYLLAARPEAPFAVSDQPSVADIFLFPQVVGAGRVGFDIAQWPRIAKLFAKLQTIPAFAKNAPAQRK